MIFTKLMIFSYFYKVLGTCPKYSLAYLFSDGYFILSLVYKSFSALVVLFEKGGN